MIVMGTRQSKKTREYDAIDRFIDDVILKNKDINCSGVPDFIEKDVYRNILRIVLGNLSEILKSCRIQFLNHVITIHIEPISQKDGESQTPL